jgi:fucose permease
VPIEQCANRFETAIIFFFACFAASRFVGIALAAKNKQQTYLNLKEKSELSNFSKTSS